MEQPLPTSAFAVPYDGVFYNEGSEQFDAWKPSATSPSTISELEVFVAKQLGTRGPSKFVESAEGSYNMMFRFRFSSGNDVAFRIPKPGHTASALAVEKMANEVAWMEYLKANTSIPVPRLYNHSLQTPNDSSPLKLPFILMDFVDGHNLRKFLAELAVPGKDAAADAMRSTVYEQVADFYLQLNRLHFKEIGSIAKDPAVSGRWEVTQRPLTMDMHQFLLGIPNYPASEWPAGPLRRSRDYFDFVAAQQRSQLWELRNLNLPKDYYLRDVDLEQVARIARSRFRARVGFKQLIPLFCDRCDDGGPFLPFNPDLDPRNMVVDPDTGRITGVFDLEFTNAMPAQFARDPPLWLYRVLPAGCLERDFFPWFKHIFEPCLDLFLAAMKRVEQRGQTETGDGEKPLSTLMLESWTSKRCWFNYAAHNADQVDAIYWAELHKLHPGGNGPELSTDMESEMEMYVKHTEKQVMEYKEAWARS